MCRIWTRHSGACLTCRTLSAAVSSASTSGSRRARGDESTLVRNDDRLYAVAQAQLGEDPGHMRLDRGGRQVEGGIALWRSHRVPVGSIILLLLFPVLDLALSVGPGPVVSHLVLLGAFGWMAIALLRAGTATPANRPVAQAS